MSDTCLLCKLRKVYHINSHLTPAGITKNTYGRRGKEHIYTIDSEERIIDEYYGRDHPQQGKVEIKQPLNSRKGIFCKKCENDLGVYETEVQRKLNSLIDNIENGASINKTKLGVEYLDIDIHPNILSVFFQSIVWRQCLEQTLDDKDNPLNLEQFEYLRSQVINNIATPVKKIPSKKRIKLPKLTVFTTYKIRGAIGLANPHPTDTNPLVFFIGSVILLYWLSEKSMTEFEQVTNIDKRLLDNSLTIDNSRIAIINEKEWDNIHNLVIRKSKNLYYRK